MMRKPTSKKMMPAKKAMMGSKMASAPMMKKGGSVKKYSDGGSTGKRKNFLDVDMPMQYGENKNIKYFTSSTSGPKGGTPNPGKVLFKKADPRPEPAKPTVTPPNRKNMPLRDGTYRKGGKSTMMRKGGKSMKGC